jgi:hypothetical protein
MTLLSWKHFFIAFSRFIFIKFSVGYHKLFKKHEQ